MATIKEDYCSYEVARLLKEKGFDEQTVRCYNLKKELCACQCNGNETINSTPNYLIAAPTLQMAMKWLREVHNLHIWVEPNHDKEGLYNAHVKVGWWSNNWGGVGYNTYEQACESAISYCLENLV